MRFSAPLDRCGELGRVLYEQGVGVCLLERTGTGWMVELMRPPGDGLVAALRDIGAVVLVNEHH